MKLRAALIAVLALGLAACGDESVENKLEGAPVTLHRVAAVDITDRIESTGELLAKERAQIAAEIGGRVTEILIDEGSAAEQGAAVLTIDPERRTLERDSARARVTESHTALTEQERDFQRIKELKERGVASQSQLDQAETQLKLARSRRSAAEAELGMQERALADALVKAPFAGLIADRLVSRGEYVTPGQKLFELVSLDPIEVEFRLTEVDSSRVKIGNDVDVRVTPFPDERFKATVTIVSPTIDSRTRTLRVKAQLANPDGRLRPGLFARVDLGIARRNGVPMIPEEAVLQRADGAVVFRVVAENRVERRLIELGTHHDGMLEVVKGIVPGDLVVLRGQTGLVDGELVSPRNDDGSDPSSSTPDVAGAGGTP
ncbi:MAG TPA: efflux RND transporter periplasmic adaptor subunit [Myxococcota bacterium]